MKIGLAIFPTDRAIRPGELAREAEERGFESLFVCEHSHQPLSMQEETGRAPADMYSRTLDPFVVLTAAAAATTTLKLGTAVCLVTQRDPIQLAKEVASLDLLSDGRVVLGVGAGWNLPEIRNHGIDPSTRWRVMAERVKAMRAIWTEEVAEFHGSYVDFSPMEAYPKPMQEPAPPVLIGGIGPNVLHRVVEFGDGWLPMPIPPDVLRPRVEELRKLASDAGRPEPTVTLFGGPADHAGLAAYEDAGVTRILCLLPDSDPDAARRALDDYAALLG